MVKNKIIQKIQAVKVQHEPVLQFRPGVLSSEFARWLIVFIVLWASHFYLSDMDAWAIALTILCVAFALGRGIFKKSRLAYVGKGERTTEFWVTLAGMIAILVEWYRGGPTEEVMLICIASCEAGYQISRGIGKSFIPKDTKLPFGLG